MLTSSPRSNPHRKKSQNLSPTNPLSSTSQRGPSCLASYFVSVIPLIIYIVVFIVVVLAFLSGALYFYKKSKEVEHRIEYEMTDVRNVASVNSYGKTIEMATIEKKEK
jgi:hypothetical protein